MPLYSFRLPIEASTRRRRRRWVGSIAVSLACLAAGSAAAPTDEALAVAQGGCSFGFCGELANQTQFGVYYSLNWPTNTPRILQPFSRVGGNGVDVDGFAIPSNCYGKVKVVSTPGPDRTVVANRASGTSLRWYKISTNDTAYYQVLSC
jgi:hypothetical protein